MSDSAWCRSQVKHLDEHARQFSHTRRGFEGACSDTHKVWADQAARDFQSHFLDPLSRQLHDLGKELHEQVEGLSRTVAQLAQSEESIRRVAVLSDAVADSVSSARSELFRTESLVSNALQTAAAALLIAEEAETILAGL